MASWFGWWAVVLLVVLLDSTHAARILGIIPAPSYSLHSYTTSLFKELASRGHEVTVISGFPLDKPIANYTNIHVPINLKSLIGDAKFSPFEFYDLSSFIGVLPVLMMGEKVSELTYKDKNVMEMIMSKKQHFDVVLLEDFANEALAGISHVFNASLIYLSPSVGSVWTDDFVGNPTCYSYIPNILLSYTDHMSFTERIHNTLLNLFLKLYHDLYFIPKQDALMRKYLLGVSNLPHVSEINAKTSLVLVNAMAGINYPKPLVPNFIPVGGLHLKTPNPLPQDLKKFLDSSTEGVIYFSMGSNIKSAEFPEQKRDSFLKAFKELKQKVLWKFEVENMPGQPDNVMIRKWLPQNDILAHPNVKLFISHGGVASSQEAVNHGVPVIGIPILGDQRVNARIAENLGYAIVIDFHNITHSSMKWALNEVLNNPRYTERAKTVSRIFHDQPQTPLQRAVYWTEYVIRHKGAPHLRSAALDLTWYQYLLLDVIAVILLIVLTVISLLVFACKKIFGSKKKQAVSIKKKNK